jgi:hypothetical protein
LGAPGANGVDEASITLLDRLFLFSPAILKLPQLTIDMHKAEPGRTQLMVKVQAIALPEHMGHGVEVCYHIY